MPLKEFEEAKLRAFGISILYDAARRLKIETGMQSVKPMINGQVLVAIAHTIKFGRPGNVKKNGLNFYDVIADAPKGAALVAQVNAELGFAAQTLVASPSFRA
ncbi:hypothetical protein ACWIGM_10295 [Bosea sp. NPDC055332]